MTKETKEIVLRTLREHRGDDYERAKIDFKNFTEKQMDLEHGHSGNTRRQVLQGYEIHVRRVEIAIKEIEAL